jgi:hypothetical protein
MYEKPQYMTGRGLRRAPRKALQELPGEHTQKPTSDLRAIVKRTKTQGITISPETAKAIALAFKAMLKQK